MVLPPAGPFPRGQAKAFFTQHAAVRKLLTVPPDPAAVDKLAKAYHSAALGEIKVIVTGGKVVFDFGEFRSEVASLKNPDGTVTFQTVDPGLGGFEFVVGDAAGKPTLTARDGQHEYVFDAK